MKNFIKSAILCVVMALIASLQLLAQDILKPFPMTFSGSVDTNQTITKFILGWNWGSPGENQSKTTFNLNF